MADLPLTWLWPLRIDRSEYLLTRFKYGVVRSRHPAIVLIKKSEAANHRRVTPPPGLSSDNRPQAIPVLPRPVRSRIDLVEAVRGF
jgi:hypothetical protein